MGRRLVVIALIVLLCLAAIVLGGVWYMVVPDTPYRGPLPPLTTEEQSLIPRLKQHLEAIASREHNVAHYDELEKSARYIETTLESYGYAVNREAFDVDDPRSGSTRRVRNIEVMIEPSNNLGPGAETLVVGAHYDSAIGAPGANDNGSGVAAVLELARLHRSVGKMARRIRFVLFVNEEMPYFRTPQMGSWQYAAALHARHERVVAMYALETIGYYTSEPGSQRYPFPFGLLFPDRGDFLAFVGMLNARKLLRASVASFRSFTTFPTIGGVAPAFIPGIDFSDHWAFADHGFPAIMLTDTAPYRYPHYHTFEDTPDKVDAEKLARVVKGIERMIRDMAKS